MKTLLVIFLLATASFTIQAQNFTLKSSTLGGQATNQEVFDGFGCSGQNVSPQLSWSGAPAGTKSFAVTMYDPDAPTGSGWWHWVVFDLPSNVTELKAGAGTPEKNLMSAAAVQSMTDFGKPGYGGPCPPEGHGYHQYIITVYALKTDKLGLDKNASPAMAGFYLNSNILAKASLVFYYKR
jgi:Raf kinase inhibitor-like YbhB/YbcL family protein